MSMFTGTSVSLLMLRFSSRGALTAEWKHLEYKVQIKDGTNDCLHDFTLSLSFHLEIHSCQTTIFSFLTVFLSLRVNVLGVRLVPKLNMQQEQE